MEKIDFRTVDESSRYTLRKRAIRLIESGKKKKDVAELFGVKAGTISEWWKLYSEKGISGLKSKKKGRNSEDMKLLSSAQEQTIQKMITDKMPDQLKLPYGLWTRKAVKELVFQEFGVKVAINTMGDYLRKWGFSPQRPRKQAYEQNNKQVQKWLKEEYPKIKAEAKKENAQIHWGDETGVNNNCNHGRSYAPKGKTPTKKSMSKKFSVNMISSITNQGQVRFMTYKGGMNSTLFISFLKRLVKNSRRKIYLIVDNLRVHHSKIVKKWVQENKSKIALFYLPSYSPELNPDEYLNCDLKQNMSQRSAPKTVENLKSNVISHMRLIQKRPNRVRKYFKHPKINYAA